MLTEIIDAIMEWKVKDEDIDKIFLVLFGIALVMIFVFYMNSVADNKTYRDAMSVQQKLDKINHKQGNSEVKIITE